MCTTAQNREDKTMNKLSLVIYLADTLPRFASVLLTCGIITIAVIAAITLTRMISKSEHTDSYTKRYHKDMYEYYTNLDVTYYVKYIWIGVFLLLVSALVPSKETFYLIAGSEAGEYVVQSEEGREIIEDIQEVIKLQLNRMKEG